MAVGQCLAELCTPIGCSSQRLASSTRTQACLPCALLDLFKWTYGLTSLACTGKCTHVPFCTAARPVVAGYGLTQLVSTVMHAVA